MFKGLHSNSPAGPRHFVPPTLASAGGNRVRILSRLSLEPLPHPFAPAQKKCCAIKKCPQINRGAQNGSRTPLKMLSLLRMRSALPCGNAVGFPVVRLPELTSKAKSDTPTTIKKYANRRLYNTGTSTYVTLEDLAAMVKQG